MNVHLSGDQLPTLTARPKTCCLLTIKRDLVNYLPLATETLAEKYAESMYPLELDS